MRKRPQQIELSWSELAPRMLITSELADEALKMPIRNADAYALLRNTKKRVAKESNS